MTTPGATQPTDTDDTDDNRRSPYRPAKMLGIAIFAMTFWWVAVGTYLGFIENTNQEYCDYVGPGEPYHLVIYDMPCRITWTAVIEPFLFLIAANIPLQSPTLILWVTIAGRERRKRRQQSMANAAAHAGNFAEFIRTLRHGSPGEEGETEGGQAPPASEEESPAAPDAAARP